MAYAHYAHRKPGYIPFQHNRRKREDTEGKKKKRRLKCMIGQLEILWNTQRKQEQRLWLTCSWLSGIAVRWAKMFKFGTSVIHFKTEKWHKSH